MLLHLKIKDFAIIDKAEIELAPGFTVITGETGAGKSILVDALCVALGGRTTTELIRNGADSAEVEALFDVSGHPIVKARLEQRDLVGDDPDVLLVRRVVGPKGKAKVLVNGHLSTVATLGEIVRGLVDVSGQHEQLSLLQVDGHIDVLDAFGELDGPKERYRAAYDGWRAVQKERTQLLARAEEAAKRADFIRYQLEELRALDPKPGEDQELEAERKRLAYAEKLRHGAELAEALLYGDDGSAFDKLGKAAAEVEALVRIDDELSPVTEALAAVKRQLEEAARDLSRYAGRIEADPARLAWLEERLSALQRVCKKHGGTLDEVLARKDELTAELDALDNADVRSVELDNKAKALGKEVLALGKELSAARHKAAKKLDKVIASELSEMELAGALFQTRLEALAASPEAPALDGSATSPQGLDAVEFMWSANKGEPARPLAKIASGGELSRLMLAVKTVLSTKDLVSLYVFDEVDTGLGGKAADAIGKKIQRVARGHQAITITHLAPIAARADHHLLVEKELRDKRTVSALKLVSGDSRTEELARMIDGARITKTTLEAARAMLSRSTEEA